MVVFVRFWRIVILLCLLQVVILACPHFALCYRHDSVPRLGSYFATIFCGLACCPSRFHVRSGQIIFGLPERSFCPSFCYGNIFLVCFFSVYAYILSEHSLITFHRRKKMSQNPFVPVTVRVLSVFPDRDVVPRAWGDKPAKAPYVLHEALLEVVS